MIALAYCSLNHKSAKINSLSKFPTIRYTYNRIRISSNCVELIRYIVGIVCRLYKELFGLVVQYPMVVKVVLPQNDILT